jgi:hypothetical protein
MRRLIEGAFRGHKDRYTLDVLMDRKVTRERILGYYRQLQTEPQQDTLLFYFAGHGGTERLRGHLFRVLSEDGTRPVALWRDEVRAAMRSHRPRLAVLLSDVCSNLIEFGFLERAAARPPAWETTRCLLLQARGLVDINAVSEGEAAVGLEEGGFFTQSLAELLDPPFEELVKELDRDGDGFLHWQELLSELQQIAQRKYATWRKQVRPLVDEELKKAKTKAERDELTHYKDQLDKQEYQTIRVYNLPSLTRFGARVVENKGRGVRVLLVHRDTAADDAGLKPGDVILTLGGKATNSPGDFTEAVKTARGQVTVEFRRTDRADAPVIRKEVRLPAWRVPSAEG